MHHLTETIKEEWEKKKRKEKENVSEINLFQLEEEDIRDDLV